MHGLVVAWVRRLLGTQAADRPWKQHSMLGLIGPSDPTYPCRMNTPTYLIGVDTGGTYTDCAIIEAQGHLAIGVTEAINLAVAQLPQGLSPQQLFIPNSSPNPDRATARTSRSNRSLHRPPEGRSDRR